MDHSTLAFVTDFGDQAVILPVLIAVAVILLAQRRWRLASVWVLAVAGVLGTMLFLKLADQACGWTVPLLRADALDLNSPSGHTASTAVVWGSGVGLAAAAATRGRSVAVAAAGSCAIAALIGWTRVELGAHSVSEAVVGGVVGVAGAVVFGLLAAPVLRGRPAVLPAVVALALAGAFHGRHLGAEPTVHSIAVDVIRNQIRACRPPSGDSAAYEPSIFVYGPRRLPLLSVM